MGMQTLISRKDSEDWDWFLEIHGKTIDEAKVEFEIALVILYGNEDSPRMIEFYAEDHYLSPKIVWKSTDAYDWM